LSLLTAWPAMASQVNVSASIPDIVPPSVPILISPSDGALTSDNTPTFRWYESTDNLALSHYVFYLNGSILFNNVPLVATENSQYKLEYDSLNGIYSLTVKSSLSDKTHTWRVMAFDYAGNSASSDTWDFIIDTLTPSFVLTKIGDTSVNISASNPSSVPSSPIIIFQNNATANEPILIANGEANSTVKLTVTIPGDPTQTFTKNISGSGNYELQLGILPRNTDIRLDFIITDQVGHVSVLEKVYFRIALQYYPTSSPTPTAAITTTVTVTPSPSPSVSPIVGLSPTPIFSPTGLVPTLTPSASPSAAPTGLIPIIPPREIIHEAVGEAIELLPESTGEKVRDFLTSELWKFLSVWFNLLLFLLFYVVAFLLLLSKFLAGFSWSLLGKVFSLLFPFLNQAWQHLVFDYRETEPSPLVKVELLDENKQVLDFAITGRSGNFNSFDVANLQSWFLRVSDANFYFPLGIDRPSQLQHWQFYQGQALDRKVYAGQSVLIPTMRAAGQENLPVFERVRIFFLYLLEYPVWFWILLVLLSAIFALRYPSPANYVVLAIYLIIGAYILITKLRSSRSVVLTAQIDGNHQFNGNLITSFFEQNRQLLRSLVMPISFGQSAALKHDFKVADLTVFAKGVALVGEDKTLPGQQVIFHEQKTDVALRLSSKI